jgi:hypothetical protein
MNAAIRRREASWWRRRMCLLSLVVVELLRETLARSPERGLHVIAMRLRGELEMEIRESPAGRPLSPPNVGLYLADPEPITPSRTLVRFTVAGLFYV